VTNRTSTSPLQRFADRKGQGSDFATYNRRLKTLGSSPLLPLLSGRVLADFVRDDGVIVSGGHDHEPEDV
jgi:hypothetical protein